MHSRYYSELVGFGAQFECKVASEMASFVQHLADQRNQIWWTKANGKITASIAIDGSSVPDDPAVLHWFIASPDLRGSGVGRRLIAAAIEFCDESRFPEVELETFRGLDAARRLYEQAGFKLIRETNGTSWGRQVVEQTFLRKLKAQPTGFT